MKPNEFNQPCGASLPFPVVISLQSNDIISGGGGGEKAITMYIYLLDTRKQHRMLKPIWIKINKNPYQIRLLWPA